jgi:hypothetical protein
MKFFEKFFHTCKFKPKSLTEMVGYNHVFMYNPRGADLEYWEIYTKENVFIMQFKPETKNILITECNCGKQNCANGL